MRRALADPRGAAHGAGPVALEGGALVGVHVEDAQLFADQLVIVLGVGHGRLEQLQPRLGRAARREGEDGASLLDVLAADVVAHQPRLAGGGAHVLGLRRDLQADRNRVGLFSLAAALGLVLAGVLAATAADAACGPLGLVGGLFGLVGSLLGLAGLARAPTLGSLGRLLSRGGSRRGGLLGLLG